jgi:enoyl-[acyl-carrier-protein] reductase (NADH)
LLAEIGQVGSPLDFERFLQGEDFLELAQELQALLPIAASSTKALAYELGPSGVRVNAVAPGSVDTPIFHSNQSRLTEHGREDFHAFVRQHYPLGGRIGTPEELAGTVLFLASDQACWITGAILPVDGGLTTGWTPAQLHRRGVRV